MIREAIEKIVNKGDLSYDEAYTVMNEIMSGQTSATQNAAFLAALSTKSARAEATMKRARDILHGELSVALDMELTEIEAYIVSRVGGM